jgi:metallo-beta-lactamase class B
MPLVMLSLILTHGTDLCRAQPVPSTQIQVPRWDARGLGPLPWQGVTCLDVNDDATRIAVGTIAPPGDPNVLLLDGDGKLLRQQRVGQRWIDQVALDPAGRALWAICTMPAGRAGDLPELFRLTAESTAAEGTPSKRGGYAGSYFHYGDHSNHVTCLLARDGDATVAVNGEQVAWLGAAGPPATAPLPLGEEAIPVSMCVGRNGVVVVGTTAVISKSGSQLGNLHVFKRSRPKPLWSRPLNTSTDDAPHAEKGLYGQPTLPDGRREELPERDEKIWAPLAIAIHNEKAATTTKWRVAVADYQGWQRCVRSSATGKEENLGVRFMPARPAITVYDQDGKVLRRFGPSCFSSPFWCDLHFLADGKRLLAWPHHWTSRGLAAQALLPADDEARTLYVLELATGSVVSLSFPDAVSDVAVTESGLVIVGCWDGRVYLLTERELSSGQLPAGIDVGGPSLVRASRDGSRIVVAGTGGVVRLLDPNGTQQWQNDLNNSVPRGLKPWVANARAMPIASGLWQLPGGRVESDLGGQRLIEAPDGLILIEAHAGLSFESEWAAIQAVGLDPMRVKYVLATHEHGDHAPGAYLWRVVTGARFVCSEEMAYTLQHHVPINSGYGFHPPVHTDIRVKEDTELDLAGLKVRALRIPGHTYGSMAWQFEKGGKSYVAFGDLVMPKGVLGYSGSINFSAHDVLSSLRKLENLRPDMVLPGHGANEGPQNTLAAGIDVGVAGGWGLIKPEKPDPYFRIAQKNIIVAAWNVGATSAAFGDIDGDGRPDLAVVTRADEGAIVKIYLNKGGRFDERPDHEIRVPQVAQPSKIRVVPAARGRAADLFVAGRSAGLLASDGKLSEYKVIPIDIADANRMRVIENGDRAQTLIARRFGGFQIFDRLDSRRPLSPFRPEVTGGYADLLALDLNGDGRSDLVTSNGQVFLREADGTLPIQPTLRLAVEEGDWNFLAVGDFNGDGRPDVVFLSYGSHGKTVARVFYNRGDAHRPFVEKPDAIIPLNPAKKDAPSTLLRDAPVVVDWNGDGIADLVVGRGQSPEVLILLGSRDGLDAKRSETITLDYRVHYETGLYVGDFNGDGRPDLAAFGYTLTGVGWNGPPAAYIWLQPPRQKKDNN